MVSVSFPAYTNYLYSTYSAVYPPDCEVIVVALIGHWRVRNWICSRAIPGETTSWRYRRLRPSLASRRLSLSVVGKGTFCVVAYPDTPPMLSLSTKMICTRRSGRSSGHFASWPVDKHIPTNFKGADPASTLLSAPQDSRGIYVREG